MAEPKGLRIGSLNGAVVAIIVYIAGYYYLDPTVQMIGIILFAHSSLDRLFGYGLKFSDAFRHTHLGWIGEEGHRA